MIRLCPKMKLRNNALFMGIIRVCDRFMIFTYMLYNDSVKKQWLLMLISSLKTMTYFNISKHGCIKFFSKNCLNFTKKNINIIQIPEIARQKLWNFFQQKHFYSESPFCYNDSIYYFSGNITMKLLLCWIFNKWIQIHLQSLGG